MRTIRIMLIEFKKTLSSNFFLCIILLTSIVISYSVFVFYNDSFYTEQRKFLSNHFKNHSVSIDFNETISYPNTVEIIKMFDDSFCNYILLSFDTQTDSETYSIRSVSALIPVDKEPYHFLYSTLSQNKYAAEPHAGYSYISNKFTNGRHGEGLYLHGTFSIGNYQYTISDICSVSYDQIEVLLSLPDFQKHNRVDNLTYVYKENSPLSLLQKKNEEILSLFPNANISINNELSELSQNAYNDSLSIIAVLLLACILNYCLIFTYLANKRCDDFIIMRLFGITKLRVMGMLLLELVLYNVVAFLISMCGFSIYWILIDDVDIMIHYRDSLPVVIVFLSGSLIIGIYNVVKLSRNMPIDYKRI